jgi:alanyl-tRNA synthetase
VVIREEADWDVAALRTLATALASGPGVVALLLGGGHPVPVVIARSEGVPFDCHAWMAQAVAVLGGRGGGRPELAQGGLAADAGAIRAFAREALARA